MVQANLMYISLSTPFLESHIDSTGVQEKAKGQSVLFFLSLLHTFSPIRVVVKSLDA